MKIGGYSQYLRRFLIILVAATFLLWAISELVFIFLNENTDRAPQRIELVIPEGTSDKILAGEEVDSIPDEMVFILGDELVLINQDVAGHELGPLFVPPKSSASLKLDEADQFAISCSFRPTKYLGLDVKEPTNAITRLEGLLFMVPSTVVVAFLYSLLVKPIVTQKMGDEEDGLSSVENSD
jgi:hypothetical protein